VLFFSFSFLFVTIQYDHNPRILLRRQRLLRFHAPYQLRHPGWNLAPPFFVCEFSDFFPRTWVPACSPSSPRACIFSSPFSVLSYPSFVSEQHPFDTCTPPFSPQVGGLGCSHDVLCLFFFFFFFCFVPVWFSVMSHST
jgi:hypothetical protein